MTALIVGATAGVGRALCEELAATGRSLVLVASGEEDLKIMTNYLSLKYNCSISYISSNANIGNDFIENVALSCLKISNLNELYFPIGISFVNDNGTLEVRDVEVLMQVNFYVVVGLITKLMPHLLKQKESLIVGFGSIAGIRGRGSNMIYSAAKRALDSYFESLSHLTANTPLRVQFYKLGYVNSAQTLGKKLLFPKISPKEVAQAILKNRRVKYINKYYPIYWQAVAFILNSMPWFIYKRIKF